MVKETRTNLPEFNPKWTGPCISTEKLSNEVFVVERDGVPTRFYIDRLRPAPRGNPNPLEIHDSEFGSDGASSSTTESPSEGEEPADEDGDARQAGEAPPDEVLLPERPAEATHSAAQPDREAEDTTADAQTEDARQPLEDADGIEQRSIAPGAVLVRKRRRRRARMLIMEPIPGSSGLQHDVDRATDVPPRGRDLCFSSDSD